MRTTRIIGATLALALAGAACGGDDGGTTTPTASPTDTGAAGGEATVEVAMQEYAFLPPASVTAGTKTIVWNNTGSEPHMAIVGKMDEGKTLADLQAAAQSESPEPPEWFDDEVATDLSINSPGVRTGVRMTLEEGTYGLLCFVTAPDGMPHVAKGMLSVLEVGPGEGGDSAPQPTASAIITDDAVNVQGVTSGENVIALESSASATYGFSIVQLAEGKTLEDVNAWFESGGEPPATFYGGVNEVRSGTPEILTFDLEAGTYTAVAIPQEEGAPLTAEIQVT